MGEDASDERRLFEPRGQQTAAYVASDLGVVRVDLAPDRIGEFSLVERCEAAAVAASDSLVAVGTPERVLIDRSDGFERVGFGPAVAVGVDGQTVFAADPNGAVGRLDAAAVGEAGATDGWEHVGTVPEPRRFDGRLLAAGDGVYRVDDERSRLDDAGSLESAGARDVAAAGPYAATDSGVFRLGGDAWQQEYEGAASVVASDGERTHALAAEGLLERDGGQSSDAAGGSWQRLALPDGAEPVDLAHGASLLAVTGDGRFLVAAADDQATDGRGGWRSRTLGVRGVVGLAVVG